MKLYHVAINVRDIEKSISFYRDTLGMEFVNRQYVKNEKGGIDAVEAFLRDRETGFMIELMQRKNREQLGREGFDHISFQVEDIDQVISRLRAEGVPIVQEKFSHKSILKPVTAQIAFAKDPSGIEVEFVNY